jgi:predicted Zn-dependent protease
MLLGYQGYLYQDADPNAAALADGRVYLSTGMLHYLGGRGSREDELAVVLAHELAHTAAQHLARRYERLQRQRLLLSLVAAGAAAATQQASPGAAPAGRLATDVAGLLADVANSGYSQEQELEADQLGIRYVIRAGYDPQAALDLLADFARFENPWPFLRTHPYITERRAQLRRYLLESGASSGAAAAGPAAPRPEELRQRLREAQRLYPVGSQSWKNLQDQLDALDAR